MMRCQRVRTLGLALSMTLPLLATGALGAEEAAPLVTDRPDQTESALVVPAGSVQVEVGATYIRDDVDGIRTEAWEVPGTLVRVGLSERFELRIGWSGWVDAEQSGRGLRHTFDGSGDAELGGKVAFGSWGEEGPEVALLFGTSVPVGDDDLTSDAWDPSFRLSVAHALPGGVDLGWNLGMAWATEGAGSGGEHTLSEAIYTVAVGFEVSERVGAFVELYGAFGGSAGGAPRHALDGGLTFALRDHLQLDVAAGVGLSDAAEDSFVGIGLSYRWPR